MTAAAGSGHPGGSLSSADIVTALYFQVMNHRPAEPAWPGRDRFILSKGHCAPILYAALARSGYFPVDDLLSLRKIDCHLQGHPDMNKTVGVEISSGSLGQGLSVSIGIALAMRMDSLGGQVFTLMGDGESQEGEVWEAANTAGSYKLGNLVGIVDRNKQLMTSFDGDYMHLEPYADKWRAFNWNVVEIDGHDMRQIVDALDNLPPVNSNKPTAIVANTTKGKGVHFMENDLGWHAGALSKVDMDRAMADIEAGYAKIGGAK